MADAVLGRPAVVAITLSPRGGGIAAVSRLLARTFDDATGVTCRVLTLAGERPDGTFPSSTWQRITFGARVAAVQAAGLCDWLCYTHLSLATAQRWLPPVVRRPYAVFLHDVEAWVPQSPFRSRVLAGAFLRLANSRYTAERVAEANPDVGPITPCPLALPGDAPPSSLLGPSVDIGPSAVLIVGRMMSTERYKGHDQLLEAWPAVVAAVPRARLVCVGEGDDVERLKAKADELGVTATTIFTGFVADGVRRSLYEGAAVFAMPSRREGFGLVYLEAMAARRPCIGANHDAASEVIEDGVTGFLVDQADTRALASRIIQVLGDEDLRRRMGEAGFRRYRDEFTYESFSRRLLGHVRTARAVRAGARQVGMSPSDS